MSKNSLFSLSALVFGVAIASSNVAWADSTVDEHWQLIFSPIANAAGSFSKFSDEPITKITVSKPAFDDWNKLFLSAWQATERTYDQKKPSVVRPATVQTGNDASYFSVRTERLWKNVQPLGSGCTEQNSDDECTNGSAFGTSHGGTTGTAGGAQKIRKPYIGLSLTKPID